MTDAPLPGRTEGSGEAGGALIRVRLDLAYDGTAYAGWARQPTLPTVQGELESALREVVSRSGHSAAMATVSAGRTDAGVHARGQVVHVDMPLDVWRSRGADRLVGQLNSLLAADIRIHAATAAPPAFDARFSALSRTYCYRICDDPARVDPLRRGHVLSTRRQLDLQSMNLAARPLVGEHDFGAFCKQREGASTVRRVLRLEWSRDDHRTAVMTVESDAFCHSMVRAVTGALVAVGEGRRDPDWPGRVLAAGVRDSAVMVMKPHGLVLESVSYPPDELLGERASQTRRLRG